MASDPRATGTTWGAEPCQDAPFPSPQSPPDHPGPATLFTHSGGTWTHVPAVPQCHPPLTSTVNAACTAWLTASSSANIQWGLIWCWRSTRLTWKGQSHRRALWHQGIAHTRVPLHSAPSHSTLGTHRCLEAEEGSPKVGQTQPLGPQLSLQCQQVPA